ncbi:META domain-containing protein [Sedimentitalea sp. JM2-8]|uniref:META domain-containing protein n=1 Tax=Sedimentitalea xiamensis TaxID=3050037 RepID=A0ABT7FCW9_9RHOB|nr:META domain-containing protein [Sedimentitalea xiamensis]MDK3072964.1 META domain-containing protein [Sedimentitalea xiamensis]
MMQRLSQLLPAGLAAAMVLAALPLAAPAWSNESAMITVTGQISYRQRIALLPGSTATVTVSDVSRADAPAQVLAEASIAAGQVPIPFSLEVPTEEMDERGRYALRATIRDAEGGLRWTTDTHIPVDPALAVNDLGMLMLVQVAAPAGMTEATYVCGDRIVSARFSPNALQLVIDGETRDLAPARSASGARYAAEDGTLAFWDKGASALLQTGGLETECIKQTARATEITGGVWRVEDINGRGTVDNAMTSLEFTPDGRVSGRGGCNQYTGSYTREGDTLTFGPLASTQMACVPALGDQEQKFFQVLSGPVTVSFDATGAMTLTNAGDQSITARR